MDAVSPAGEDEGRGGTTGDGDGWESWRPRLDAPKARWVCTARGRTLELDDLADERLVPDAHELVHERPVPTDREEGGKGGCVLRILRPPSRSSRVRAGARAVTCGLDAGVVVGAQCRRKQRSAPWHPQPSFVRRTQRATTMVHHRPAAPTEELRAALRRRATHILHASTSGPDTEMLGTRWAHCGVEGVDAHARRTHQGAGRCEAVAPDAPLKTSP